MMGSKSAFSLNSINARGTTGKEWVYWVAHGIQYRRKYIVPPDPLTPRQQSKRAFFRMGMAYWKNLSPTEKAEYAEKAENCGKSLISYNYFMSLWLRGEIVMESIKSIQRGVVSCINGYNNVTISQVEMAKSIVIINSYSTAWVQADVLNLGAVLGGELTTSTNLRILAVKIVTGAPAAYWQVIEYY